MIALIHIKKTAGKSLKHIMRCEMGIRHCDVKRWHRDDPFYSAADLARLTRVYPWLQSIAGHSIRAYSDVRTQFPRVRYYSFFRDPLRRCVSEYQYSVLKGRWPGDSFAAWIEKPQFRNVQVQSLAGSEDLSKAIALLDDEIAFAGLMERFDESLALMTPILGCARLRSRRQVNAAPGHRIRDRVLADPGAVRALRQANQLDCELYDYITRKIFKRQQQRASRTSVRRPAAQAWPAALPGRFLAGGAYRFAVYKPVVSAYRTLSNKNGAAA